MGLLFICERTDHGMFVVLSCSPNEEQAGLSKLLQTLFQTLSRAILLSIDHLLYLPSSMKQSDERRIKERPSMQL